MRLSQANSDLAEAAEKLEAIRKKLTVSQFKSLQACCFHSFISSFIVVLCCAALFSFCKYTLARNSNEYKNTKHFPYLSVTI